MVEAGAGTTALVEPVISGSVKEVLIDPQDFDIAKVISISLTGGNGSGCLLQPIVGGRFRDLLFDTRNVFFGGGVDIDEETVTFTQPHNLVLILLDFLLILQQVEFINLEQKQKIL